MPLFIIFCLFTALAHSFNTSTLRLLTPALASNTTSPAFLHHAFTSNATIFAPLAAPLYRNVTAGDAWVFPSSANDLGARDMSCECFNPGGGFLNLYFLATKVAPLLIWVTDQCCMPTSPSVGPFCMPTGSTCCGDTFCVVGETCCGEYCCAPVSLFFPFHPSLLSSHRLPYTSASLTEIEQHLQPQSRRLRLLPHRQHLLRSCHLLRSRLVQLLQPSGPSATMLSHRHTLLPRLQASWMGLLCQFYHCVLHFKRSDYDCGGHFESLHRSWGNVYEHGC